MSLLLDALKQAEKSKSEKSSEMDDQSDFTFALEKQSTPDQETELADLSLAPQVTQRIENNDEITEDENEHATAIELEVAQPELDDLHTVEFLHEESKPDKETVALNPSLEADSTAHDIPVSSTEDGTEISVENPTDQTLQETETQPHSNEQKSEQLSDQQNIVEEQIHNTETERSPNTKLQTKTDPEVARHVVELSQHAAYSRTIFWVGLFIAVILILLGYWYFVYLPGVGPQQGVEEIHFDADEGIEAEVGLTLPSELDSKAPESSQKPAGKTVEKPLLAQNAKPKTTAAVQTQTTAPSAEYSSIDDAANVTYPGAIKIRVKKRSSKISNYLNMAYKSYKKADIKTAEKLYHQVHQLDYKNIDALLGLAAVAHYHGDTPKAETYYEKVLNLDETNEYARNALIKLKHKKNPRDQESQLKFLIDKNPQDARSHAVLADLLMSQKRWSDAQESYFKAADIEPENAEYRYNLAVCLDYLAKHNLALRYYQEALSLAPQDSKFDRAVVEQRIQQLQGK